MPLMIGKNNYDDTVARKEATILLGSLEVEDIKPGHERAEVDLEGWRKGVIYGIEVGYTEVQPLDGMTDMPKRKWGNMRRALGNPLITDRKVTMYPSNTMPWDRGIYVHFFHNYERVLLFSFTNLLTIDDNDPANIISRIVNGKKDDFVIVSIALATQEYKKGEDNSWQRV